jgi:plastocyanin
VTKSVTVQNSGYTPATVTIPVGSTVIWTNDGGIAHTVTETSGPMKFDSGNMNPGKTYRFTFTKPGTYKYDCTYHPFMLGTVIVT